MSDAIVLAVDGGNSKTDLALVRDDGTAARTRARPAQLPAPHRARRLARACSRGCSTRRAQRRASDARPARWRTSAPASPASTSPPRRTRCTRRSAPGAGPTTSRSATTRFAVLRAGTERGGASQSCAAPGSTASASRPTAGRFASPRSGDHRRLGRRIRRGARGPRRRGAERRRPRAADEPRARSPGALRARPPAHARRGHPYRPDRAAALIELAPLVFAEAAHDAVAAGIVARLADEIVALARATLVRLGLDAGRSRCVLGGGLLRAGDRRLLTAIELGLAAVGAAITRAPDGAPPVVGAALLGLDALGADAEAQARLRRQLTRPDADRSAHRRGGCRG